MTTRLLVRWSRRDLRQRWVLVGAIALVLALGTGMFAALGSTSTWRRDSNDASFAATAFHDLLLVVPAGETVPEGSLEALVPALPHAGWVTAADERLRVPTQIEADGGAGPVLVRGELVGIDVSTGEPAVDRVHVEAGEPLGSGGSAVLEQKFADEYGLPARGSLGVGGDNVVPYTAVGVGPEEFLVIGDDAGLLGHRNWATVYLPLDRAQELAGVGNGVDRLAVRAGDGADVTVLADELRAAARRQLGGMGVDIRHREDAIAYRTLYDDIANDEKVWTVLAGLILAGAGFATFNLVSRVVEAQRREIGMGMALGAPPRQLAVRPVLLGVQVGGLGALLGIGVGLLVGEAMKSFMTAFLPLPVWDFGFQPWQYVRGVSIGLVIPLLATLLPVWRAVRVEPVEALRTIQVQTAGGVLGRFGAHVRVPGRSLAQLPLRNLLRAPRRAVLTALAIAAAVTTLVAVLGMLDSLFFTLERAEREALQGRPDRLDVQLRSFVDARGPELDEIATTHGVGDWSAGLQLPAQAVSEQGERIELLLRAIDLDAGVWRPTVADSAAGTAPTEGVLLSRKAADDLGVSPGDTVVVRHPRSEAGVLSLVETVLPVAGIHPDPVRGFAYLDISWADTFGLAGMRNFVQLETAEGATVPEVRRALFPLSQVAASQSVSDLLDTMDEATEEFTGFLRVLQAGLLALALLIAFNAASISSDERAREHATMFAFGVPVRSVTAVNVAETAAIGLLGTAMGLAGGYVVVRWMVEVLLNDTLPELGMIVHVSATTVVTTLILGVVVVALAPLLGIRRLSRMPVPDTLRLVE